MIYPTCSRCGCESRTLNQVEQASFTEGPGHRTLWTAMLCEKCREAVRTLLSRVGGENTNTDGGASIRKDDAGVAPCMSPPSASPAPAREGVIRIRPSGIECDIDLVPPPAPAREEWTEEQRDAAFEVFKAGAYERDVFKRDELLCAAIQAVAPRFVRAKLPDPKPLQFPSDLAAAYNRALRDCAAALRSAGIPVEER